MVMRFSPVIHLDDLLLVKEVAWPHVTFSDYQVALIESVLYDRETYVPAANKMGKDFISGFIPLAVFIVCMSRGMSCKIITTSVSEKHIDTMWGEIGTFLLTSKIPLTESQGGPLRINAKEIRLLSEWESKNPLSFLRGQVSESEEGLAGHHADYTLAIGDESSGIADTVYKMFQGWAKHMLWIGNPNPCGNFWRKAIKQGDIAAYDDDTSYRNYRKVIRLKAEDSPNVKRGLQMQAKGLKPDGKVVIRGLLEWNEYLIRLRTWDENRKKVGLGAQFDESPDALLFPPEWVAVAREWNVRLNLGKVVRKAESMGCDSAEGGDDTTWTIVDKYGVLEVIAMKTPNTTVIPSKTIELGEKWGISPLRWVFDRGGGGKQHVDRLREMGYQVHAVGFGEKVELPIKPGTQKKTFQVRRAIKDQGHTYLNRRAQMYHEASLLLDPSPVYDEGGIEQDPELFALPAGGEYDELERQLTAIPKYARIGEREWSMWDSEGKIRMLPKTRKSGTSGGSEEVKELCLTDLIGRSPDHADSFVLAVYGMLHIPNKKFWMR